MGRTTKREDKYKVSRTNLHSMEDNIEDRTTFFYHAFRNILLVSIPLLLISALILSLPHSSAVSSDTSGTDNVQLVLSTSCTVNAVVTSEHSVSLNGGQLDNNVGNTKLSAYCNDNNGYGIYAVGSSGDVDGNTELINTVNESYNIRTGVYDDTIQSNPSSWAMKLTAGTGTGIDPVTGESVPTTPPTIINGFDNYSAIPNVYTLVAKRASGTSMTTDTSVSGSYLSTTYQIYANSAQPSGTYNGKVKYVMVHPSSNINTVPDLDTAFAVNGKMKVYEEGGNSYYAMQDMDGQICSFVSNTGISTATQLVDTRDNNLYWVAKLDDGKCWMTENLDLDIGGTNVAALTSENTDISTDASVYASSGVYSDYGVSDGVYTWNPASTAITSNYYIDGTKVKPSAWPTDTTGQTTPYSLEGGVGYVYSSGSTSNDTKYTTLASCATNGRTEAECKRYATGNFYNWTAAIASNNSTNLGSTPETIATNSICPKGWRLPNASQTDNVNNEFGRMLYKAGITLNLSAGNESVGYATGGFNKLRSNPYYFVRSGNIDGGNLYVSGVGGLYWSSTVSSSTIAYSLSFTGTDIYPARNSYRYLGRSVRCVAR